MAKRSILYLLVISLCVASGLSQSRRRQTISSPSQPTNVKAPASIDYSTIRLLWKRTVGLAVDDTFVVNFSPDSRTLAVATWNGTLRLFDTQTGALKRKFDTTGSFVSIAFSLDGKKLFTVSWIQDIGTVRIWDAKTLQLLLHIPISGRSSYAVFSPDSKTLACSSQDVEGDDYINTVRLVDADTGQLRHVFLREKAKGQNEELYRMKFSPNGKLIAIHNEISTRIFDVQQGKVLFTLTGYRYPPGYVSFSPDSTMIASTGIEGDEGLTKGEVILWDAHTGELKRVFPGAGYFFVAFSPDGRTLACVDSNSRIGLLDVETWTIKRKISRTKASPDLFGDFSPNGKMLVTLGSEFDVKLWKFGVEVW